MILVSAGAEKIKVIKLFRVITGWPQGSKDWWTPLADRQGSSSHRRSQRTQSTLEEVGATVELK